ncbi:MarR family winged helix-turn-helix transcriptional regulator [Nonomuraea rubra]|uniref:MarR family winged helix-turn-helix transcriptional regulator n=1 Tax=Nonomuraea rubra TaxID=46180 RepID=UPI0033F7DBEC
MNATIWQCLTYMTYSYSVTERRRASTATCGPTQGGPTPTPKVLVALSESPEGRTRTSDLAALLRWERSRVSHHVTRMEKRDLVSRQGCPDDGPRRVRPHHRDGTGGHRAGRAGPCAHRTAPGPRRAHRGRGGSARRDPPPAASPHRPVNGVKQRRIRPAATTHHPAGPVRPADSRSCG